MDEQNEMIGRGTADDGSILSEAVRLTSGDRMQHYDHPLPNHERIAALWNAFLGGRPDRGRPLAPDEVCHMMILVKISRDMFRPREDNLVDIAGYARCIQMIREVDGKPNEGA